VAAAHLESTKARGSANTAEWRADRDESELREAEADAIRSSRHLATDHARLSKDKTRESKATHEYAVDSAAVATLAGKGTEARAAAAKTDSTKAMGKEEDMYMEQQRAERRRANAAIARDSAMAAEKHDKDLAAEDADSYAAAVARRDALQAKVRRDRQTQAEDSRIERAAEVTINTDEANIKSALEDADDARSEARKDDDLARSRARVAAKARAAASEDAAKEKAAKLEAAYFKERAAAGSGSSSTSMSTSPSTSAFASDGDNNSDSEQALAAAERDEEREQDEVAKHADAATLQRLIAKLTERIRKHTEALSQARSSARAATVSAAEARADAHRDTALGADAERDAALAARDARAALAAEDAARSSAGGLDAHAVAETAASGDEALAADRARADAIAAEESAAAAGSAARIATTAYDEDKALAASLRLRAAKKLAAKTEAEHADNVHAADAEMHRIEAARNRDFVKLRTADASAAQSEAIQDSLRAREKARAAADDDEIARDAIRRRNQHAHSMHTALVDAHWRELKARDHVRDRN
jgi:hypothetical protein